MSGQGGPAGKNSTGPSRCPMLSVFASSRSRHLRGAAWEVLMATVVHLPPSCVLPTPFFHSTHFCCQLHAAVAEATACSNVLQPTLSRIFLSSGSCFAAPLDGSGLSCITFGSTLHACSLGAAGNPHTRAEGGGYVLEKMCILEIASS